MSKEFRRFKLFGEIWSIGKCSKISTGQWHSVIYNNGKEYHVYDQIALSLRIGDNSFERADIEKTKLYILTNILDKNQWHTLHDIPKIGAKIKVIYKGITVKWITFNESWENCQLEYLYSFPICLNPKWKYNNSESQFLWKSVIKYKNIIAWRYEDTTI